jgi:hypothetical protein
MDWFHAIDLLAGEYGDIGALFGGNDTLGGGDGNDKLFGEDADDFLFGDANDDTLVGGDGTDWYYGGAGNDKLHAWDDGDDDHLYGEAGWDEFWGGDYDFWRFRYKDRVHDAEPSELVHRDGGFWQTFDFLIPNFDESASVGPDFYPPTAGSVYEPFQYRSEH